LVPRDEMRVFGIAETHSSLFREFAPIGSFLRKRRLRFSPKDCAKTNAIAAIGT
jgi:hypothetical protein